MIRDPETPMDTVAGDFVALFKELTGYAPYPWQERLYEQLRGGRTPDALDVPTGLGKTSVMSIWLLACLCAEGDIRPARRLVYVVNRRTIVDQATEVAESFWPTICASKELRRRWAARYGDEELAVSTLRGARADNGDWLTRPHVPAIVIGTVDMIGSRLLFNAYRAGRWQRSRHAGLLGQDSLLVHDEAHLSRPFQRLLDWIITRQSRDGSPRRAHVLAMSATAASEHERTLTIDEDDRRIAIQKLTAAKGVYLHEPEAKLAAQIAELAAKHDADAARVLVYVRTVKTAMGVYDEMKRQKVDVARMELLTGTIRGHERDELVKKPILQDLLHSRRPKGTQYLISTSAGEVGADFDADHLVCDLTTIDCMIQRFGRVNRRGGEGRAARIDLVLNVPVIRQRRDNAPAELSGIDRARAAAARFLTQLPRDGAGGIDASPQAVGGWRRRDGYDDACEPVPAMVTPHDVVLDAWAMTSIQTPWPLSQDVHPYLHGLDDPDPEVFVAWRSELDEMAVAPDEEIDAGRFQKVVDNYPLRPQELVRDQPDRVAELLLSLRKRLPDKLVAFLLNGEVTVQRLGSLEDDARRLKDQIRYRTVILPPSAGALNESGMISEKAEAEVTDVADLGEPGRQRLVRMLNEDGEWSPDVPADMRQLARIVFAEDDEGRPTRVLLLLAARPVRAGAASTATLDEHGRDVRRVAAEIAKALTGLPDLAGEAVALAAQFHDLGKGHDCGGGRWQRAIGNDPANPALAKSNGGRCRWDLLDGYRHEFGSLLAALGRLPQSPARELALHLIGSHHGRGRPGFEADAGKTETGQVPEDLTAGEIARRFDRLQRRLGHWGLAWLESLVMAADARASAQCVAAPGEDETQSGDDRP